MARHMAVPTSRFLFQYEYRTFVKVHFGSAVGSDVKLGVACLSGGGLRADEGAGGDGGGSGGCLLWPQEADEGP
jgi:hypothetical protein